MKDYNLRFSFTAVGEEGIAQLKAFRDRLVDLDSKALSQVYREFDIAPLRITPEDAVTDISIVHVTHADKDCGYLSVNTETQGMAHRSLWTTICRHNYPAVQTAMVGEDSDKNHFCEDLQ